MRLPPFGASLFLVALELRVGAIDLPPGYYRSLVTVGSVLPFTNTVTIEFDARVHAR